MKNFYLFSIFILLCSNLAQAQSDVKHPRQLIKNVKTNCENRYYYYPNLEAYFDQKYEVYIYNLKGEWITAESLPNGFRGYSVFNKINVLIDDFDEDNPVSMIEVHKKKFPFITKKSRELSQASVSSF